MFTVYINMSLKCVCVLVQFKICPVNIFLWVFQLFKWNDYGYLGWDDVHKYNSHIIFEIMFEKVTL